MGTSRSTKRMMQQNAEAQIKATKDAAAAQSRAAIDAARAAADQQSLAISRVKAEEAVQDVLSKPLESAQVTVDAPATDTAAAVQRKRRASFGQGGTTGVSI